MQVIFRDEIDSPHPIAAKGILQIPEGDDIGQYVGHLLPFTITEGYSDVPLRTYSEGIIAEVGSERFYEFQIVEMDERIGAGPRSGRLRILSEAKKRSKARRW